MWAQEDSGRETIKGAAGIEKCIKDGASAGNRKKCSNQPSSQIDSGSRKKSDWGPTRQSQK